MRVDAPEMGLLNSRYSSVCRENFVSAFPPDVRLNNYSVFVLVESSDNNDLDVTMLCGPKAMGDPSAYFVTEERIGWEFFTVATRRYARPSFRRVGKRHNLSFLETSKNSELVKALTVFAYGRQMNVVA